MLASRAVEASFCNSAVADQGRKNEAVLHIRPSAPARSLTADGHKWDESRLSLRRSVIVRSNMP
jgi:hypothetical protein